MKKFILLLFIAATGFTANAQFSAGVSAGLPIGDSGDTSGFAILADFNYLFEVGDTFAVGPSVGVQHNFGKDYTFDDPFTGTEITVDGQDLTWVPISVAGRFSASDSFWVGANLGYGIGVAPDGLNSGFYYAPGVGFSVSDLIDIVAAYRGISLDGTSWNLISLGLEFGID